MNADELLDWAEWVADQLRPRLADIAPVCEVVLPADPTHDWWPEVGDVAEALEDELGGGHEVRLHVHKRPWAPVVFARPKRSSGELTPLVLRPPGLHKAGDEWPIYERLVLDGLGHDEALETAELLAD